MHTRRLMLLLAALSIFVLVLAGCAGAPAPATGDAAAPAAEEGAAAPAPETADAAEEPGAEGEHGVIDLHASPAGGHVVLFSDFLGDLTAVQAALSLAAARTMRGILVQVLDPAEESFPYDGRTRFESMSGHLSFETLRAGDLRGDYRDRLAARKDQLQAMARQSGWHATTLHTDRPATEGLLWLYQALGEARRR